MRKTKVFSMRKSWIFVALILVCSVFAEDNSSLFVIDKDLLPIPSDERVEKILLAGVDGRVSCVDPTSGSIDWTFDTGDSLISSAISSMDSINQREFAFIPSLGEKMDLYRISRKDKFEIEKFPASVKDVVQLSPFTAGDSMFIGSKDTQLFHLDLQTGILLGEYSSNPAHPSKELAEILRKHNPQTSILIGREDFHVEEMNVCPEEEILGWNFSVSAVKFPTLKMTPSSHSLPFFIVPSKVLTDNEDDSPSFAWRENLIKLDTNQRKMEWNLLIPSPVIFGVLLINGRDTTGKPIRYLREIPFIIPQEAKFQPSSEAMFVLSEYEGKLFAKESKSTLDILSLFSSHSDSVLEMFWPAAVPSTGNQVAVVQDQEICVPVLFNMQESDSPLFCIPWANPTVSRPETPNQNPILLLPSGENRTSSAASDFSSDSMLWLAFVAMALIAISAIFVAFWYRGKSQSKTQKIILGPQVIGIGKLKIFLDKILGKGSCGTIVYLGEYQGRTVAVKRILKEFYELAQKEISILLESDHHDNMVTYFAQEQDDQFIYLALSYCPKTLADVVEKTENMQKLTWLRQLSKAVAHLHSLNIVHKDIKPQNVLVDSNQKAKLSDMGLAKKLAGTHGSISFHAHEGSLGWEAPEIILFRMKSKGSSSGPFFVDVPNQTPQKQKGKKAKPKQIPLRITKEVDIFSLGCVFYYTLTGEHPFGDQIKREENVIKGNINIEKIQKDLPEAYDLIKSMCDFDPDNRPSAEFIENHPMFWSDRKRLNFLKEASDRLEIERMELKEHGTESEILDAYEEGTDVVNDDWKKQLDEALLNNLGKYRKYEANSCVDLLRVIRNKVNHYYDLEPETKALLGDIPSGFLKYFSKRFPRLLIHTYSTLRAHCEEEKVFRKYFAMKGTEVVEEEEK